MLQRAHLRANGNKGSGCVHTEGEPGTGGAHVNPKECGDLRWATQAAQQPYNHNQLLSVKQLPFGDTWG